MDKEKSQKINNKLFLVAGGTSSGKSLLMDEAVARISENDVTLLRMDNYYKTLTQLNKASVSEVNWDEPNAYNWNQIISDIKNLLNNQKVNGHKYNYQKGEYEKDKKFTIYPAPIIILEGIYALFNEELRDISSLKIFIFAKNSIRKKRRIKRDSLGRYKETFDIEKFNKKWKEVITPMHNKFIEPSKKYADIVIKNNSNKNIKEKTKAIAVINALMVK